MSFSQKTKYRVNIPIYQKLIFLISIIYLCLPIITNAQNTWTQKANFGGGARQGAVSFVINGNAYVGTGKDGLSAYKDIWEYNPTNNTWSQKADFGGVVRSNATGVATSTKGYIGLGISFSGLTVYQDFYEYDPTLNTWTAKTNFSGSARSKAVGFSINDKVYIGTGATLIASRSDFYEYDPTLNTWTAKTSYDGGIRSEAVAFSIGGFGYIGCGTTGLTKQNDFWQYNPTLDTWTQKTNFGGSTRTAAVGFNIYNKGYIATGINVSNLDDMYEYDPSNNTWLVRASFSGGLRNNGIAFGIDGFGYLGTGNNLGNNNDLYQYTPGTTPSVNTTVISSITSNTASSGGNVIFDGTYSVTARGIVWSTSSNPTIASQPGGGITNNSTGTGTFTSSLTGLLASTQYYYRAYATNSQGTSYGTEYTFTTLAERPTISSSTISLISTTSATGGGNVTSDGGDAVTARGLVWSSTTNPPTITSYEGITTTGTGAGPFTQSINALCPGTTYYVRAYATNSFGTSYGAVQTFTTTNSPGDIWVAKTSFPNTRRWGFANSTTSKGYHGCGYDGSTWHNDFWEYDPITNVWTQKANYTGSGRVNLFNFSLGGKIYAGMGSNGSSVLSDFHQYDPSLNTWISRAAFGGGARASGFSLSINGKGYAGLGYDNSITYIIDNWEYDPIGNSWTSKTTFPGAYREQVFNFTINNIGYVGAGSGASSYSDTYNYNPITDTWTQLSNYSGVSGSKGDAFSVGNKGYVNPSNNNQEMYEYDPTNDIWTPKTNFLGGNRSNVRGFSIGQKAYIGLGHNGTSIVSDFYEYTPNTIPQFICGSAGSITNSRTTISATYDNNYNGCSSSPITDHGLVWHTTSAPTTGTNTGSYSAGAGNSNITNYQIMGLNEATTYYVRSYSTSAQGTRYGNEVSFTTLARRPTISSSTISLISTTSATGGGNVTSDGGDAVTARGLVWSSTTNPPTIITNEGITTTGTGTGSFTQSINALCPGTTYYVRAYATNSIGTSYGTVQTFTTTNSPGDIWVQKANFGGGGRNQAVISIINEKIYYGTGFDGGLNNDFWEYDINSNFWTQKANFGGVARQNAFSFAINSKVYIGGGTNGAYQNDFWEYDPINNTWTAKANFPSNGLSGCVATSYLNNGYVGLGIGNIGYVNEFWRYNSSLNTWTSLANFPGTERYASSIFIISRNIYVSCGYDYLGDYKKDNYQYNISTDNWTQKADNLDDKFFATGFSIGAKGYLVGGNAGAISYDNLQEYDPTNDKWINRTTYPNGTFSRATAVGTNKKGYLLNINDFHEYTPSTIRTFYITEIDSIVPISAQIKVEKDNYFNGCISQAIIDKGIVWDINPNPTISTFSGKYSDGNINQDFTNIITNLNHTTQYYIRSYTQTIQGVNYGNEETFTTPSPTAPFLGITSLNGVGDYSASIKHSITSDGYSDIIQSGILISTNPTPTIASYIGGNKIITNNEIVETNSTITNLIPQTQYYLRTFSTNSIGTTYSNEINFVTQSISNDDDNDGIDDIAEENGPNEGDGNGDGIPDNLQSNVASFYFDENGNFVTLEAQNCASLSNVRRSDPENSNEWIYPFGVIEFLVPCSQVDMKIYYHGIDSLNNYAYRKTNSNGIWGTYTGAIFNSQIINGQKVATVIFPLSDGSNGDSDGVVNGQILDPGGPAIPASLLTTNIPTLSEWARIILVSFMILFGGIFIYKRSLT